MKGKASKIIYSTAIVLMIALMLEVIAPRSTYAKYASTTQATVKLSVERSHYFVRFNANAGGDVVEGLMADQSFAYNEARALTMNAFRRSGYVFVGWNTKASGNGIDYENGEEVLNLGRENGEIVNLYARWEEATVGMNTVFELNGACAFHGSDMYDGGSGIGYITGDSCISNGNNWADGAHRYIDTGVSLYSQDNYDKDYEIGFSIVEYDPNGQGDGNIQATFMNAKLEDGARRNPGLVIRRSNNNIEFTQGITWPNHNYDRKAMSVRASNTTKVVVARVDGVVYYSVNDGQFVLLQDINGSADYFDTTVWFGAAADANGAPWRYLDATLQNFYVKLGERGSNKHIVSFDAGGIVANPDDVIIVSTSKIGTSLPSMPGSVETESGRKYFRGWFTGQNGTGTEITSNTVVGENMTAYAYWRDDENVCSITGGAAYSTFDGCVTAIAGAAGTITLTDNVKMQDVKIANGREVILDLNGFTISDNNVDNKPIIENRGKLTVINGTITSSAAKAGVINNESTGKLYIGNGARIIATGARQAIYNNGGETEIGGDAYLSAASTERAAVHNLNSGTLTITGGTIVSTGQVGVENASGTLTIGVPGLPIDREALVIQGATYGVTTVSGVAMYDGELRGGIGAISGSITTTESGATAIGLDPEVVTTIDGEEYKILYYQ